MVEKNVFSKFKVYGLKLMTLAAGFLFFLLVQKETKKTPLTDYTPVSGSSYVDQ